MYYIIENEGFVLLVNLISREKTKKETMGVGGEFPIGSLCVW